MTTYVVLRAFEDDRWEIADTVVASGPERACRAAIDAHRDAFDLTTGAMLVAVPLRSWHPITLRTQSRLVKG